MSSQRVSPWPVEMKSQPRRGSAENRWDERMPLRPLPLRSLVLAVHVVDPLGELQQEADVIQALPDHVRGFVVESKAGSMTDGVQGLPSAPVVVGDLAGVHLVGVPDADVLVDVEDGVPAVGEVGVAGTPPRTVGLPTGR